jgi:CheY-like chemotaxis protein
LLAEDNVVVQKMVNRMLTQMGHVCTIVGDGRQAIDAFVNSQQGTFDLILMDIFMPNMDGITATKWIRAHEEGHIPIIALTAQATTTDKQTCLLAGMDAFLAKPAKFGVLQQAILEVMTSTQQKIL